MYESQILGEDDIMLVENWISDLKSVGYVFTKESFLVDKEHSPALNMQISKNMCHPSLFFTLQY